MKKICTKCKEEKDISNFYKNEKYTTDGHRGQCKKCMSEYSNKKQREKLLKTKKFCINCNEELTFNDYKTRSKFCHECSPFITRVHIYVFWAKNSKMINKKRKAKRDAKKQLIIK